MTHPLSVARVARSFLGTLVVAGCSATSLGVTADGGSPADDAAIVGDTGPRPDDAATEPDAGLDAGPLDAGPAESRCFEDVELVTVRGGREIVQPGGLFAHDGGWVAVYAASSHGGPSERTAVFLDRDGRVTARQSLGIDDVFGGSAVLERFVLTWQYARTRLYEIGDGELVDRTEELLDPVPPGWIQAVEAEGDRLRVLSSTHVDASAGSFRFAYSEIVLGADGLPTTRTAELPSVETLGSPGLVDGLTRYHQIHSFAMHEDTFLFAFPTGEDEYDLFSRPWNIVRVALDRTSLESGEVSWAVIDETRWEEGPLSMFGALPDLDLAIAGWFRASDDGGRSRAEVTAERFVAPAPSPIVVTAPEEFPRGELGRVSVIRRGDTLAIASPSQFRVFTLPALEARASTPLDLLHAILAWGEAGVVLELGVAPIDDGLRGLVRCHELRDVP